MQDLTYLDENRDSVDGKINLSKYVLISNVLKQIDRYRTVKYDIQPLEPLYTYLLRLPSLTDDDLYALSNVREPKGAEFKSIL